MWLQSLGGYVTASEPTSTRSDLGMWWRGLRHSHIDFWVRNQNGVLTENYSPWLLSEWPGNNRGVSRLICAQKDIDWIYLNRPPPSKKEKCGTRPALTGNSWSDSTALGGLCCCRTTRRSVFRRVRILRASIRRYRGTKPANSTEEERDAGPDVTR